MEQVSQQSRAQLTAKAATVGLLLRHIVTLSLAVVALGDPTTGASVIGRALLAAIASWSAYRLLLTRTQSAALLGVDYAVVLAVCLAIPVLTPDPLFYTANSAPQAIAGTAVISFGVAVPGRLSLPMTAGIAAAYACGAAGVVGWAHVAAVGALYYFVLQWVTTSLIRLMLVRVTEAVDQATAEREAAELDETVASAVRDYELDHLSLLHDTAAATLLMAGHNTDVSDRRVAAQARRDLELLPDAALRGPLDRFDVVAALRACAMHIRTPSEFDVPAHLWTDGVVGQVIVFAAREAMNNVDRHARAEKLTITVAAGHIRLQDNGIGFDPANTQRRHGIAHSIVSRMARIGGDAAVRSGPGDGTVVDLRWSTDDSGTEGHRRIGDAEKLIAQMRWRYGAALATYALANLAFTVPQAALLYGASSRDLVLAAIAAACTAAMLPSVWGKRWCGTWPAVVGLLGIAVLQPIMLPADLLGSAAHWSQGATGWCLLPLLLGLPLRLAAPLLALSWVAGAGVQLMLNPVAENMVNVAYGTASIFGVQVFALAFGTLMRDAANAAADEGRRRRQVLAEERVAAAVHTKYQERLADLIREVVPTLEKLSRAQVIDAALRKEARIQSRKMRTIFDRVDIFEHPLLRQLRPWIDAAEDRYVALALETDRHLPALTDSQIAAVTTPFTHVLPAASESARLVFAATGDEFRASLVVIGVGELVTPIPIGLSPDARAEVTTDVDCVWVEVRCDL